MLSKSQFIQQLSATIGKQKVLELSRILQEQQFAIRDLVDITFHENKDIAFRAAWLLENDLTDPAIYVVDLQYILESLPKVKYPSCQRHYAKIIMHITSPKAPNIISTELETMNLEPVIEQLFDWMINPEVKIAVKVFASEALFNLRDRHRWITEELANQVSYLMQNGTAAIQVRGRKILNLLNR